MSLLFILFIVALIASVFDTMVGGGGLITLPALLMAGLPGQLALGTNKLQGAFGSGSATFRFMQKERHSLKRITLGVVFTAIGASIGALSVLHLNPQHLSQCIPPVLLLVLLYAIFSKRIRGNEEHLPCLSYPVFMIVFGLLIGAYDAFLGPGTGAFWAASLVAFLGFSIRKATMYTKVFNFTSNFVSLLFFIVACKVNYKIGLVMGAGQMLGGQIGAHLVLKQGHRWIRPVYIGVVSILLISLSYKTYF